MADPMITDPGVLESFEKGTDPAARIAAATADVRRVCGWHVAPSLTETIEVAPLRGGSAILWLPSMKVTTIASILDPDGVEVPVGTFAWDENTGAVWRTDGAWWHEGAYTVDLTHGYAMVPEDLRDVILARAARAQADPTGRLAQVSRGPFSEQYNTGGVSGFDPAKEARTIAKYRIPRVR